MLRTIAQTDEDTWLSLAPSHVPPTPSFVLRRDMGAAFWGPPRGTASKRSYRRWFAVLLVHGGPVTAVPVARTPVVAVTRVQGILPAADLGHQECAVPLLGGSGVTTGPTDLVGPLCTPAWTLTVHRGRREPVRDA